MAKTVAELDEQIAVLKARKQKLRAEEGKRKRSHRNHALAVFGGEVVKALGGDYTRIDPQQLANYLQQWKNAMKKEILLEEPIPHDEYNKRIRAWEKAQREKSKGKQGLEDNSGYPQAPAESVAPGPAAASNTPQNQAQSADALGVDFRAFSPFVEQFDPATRPQQEG